MWGVYNADLYSEDDREIEVMEPVRVLNLFTIMNRGGAETMVMNYYRKINREKVQFDFLVHREEEGAYEQEIKELGDFKASVEGALGDLADLSSNLFFV